VGYNPGVMTAQSASEGTFFSGAGGTFFFPGIIDNGGGRVSFISGSLTGAVNGVNGDGLLATLSFTAVGGGSTTLSIFNLSAFDSFGEGTVMSASNGTVQVNGTPEPPASWYLVGVAPLLFALWRRSGHSEINLR